jgi:AraC-like DNA-binding protein
MLPAVDHASQPGKKVSQRPMPPFFVKIIDIIISAGAAQGFFFGILLTTNRNRKSTSDKILAVLLIVLSSSILHSLLATPVFDSPYKIREPFILFLGPLLYFYIYELIGAKKLVWKDAIHFLPFVLLIMVLMPIWATSGSSYATFLNENGLFISKVIWLLIVLQFGYYWSKILSVLHRHQIAVESEFSNLEGKTLSWVQFFLHVFGLFLFLLVLTVVIAFHTRHYDLVDTIVCLGLSCAIFVLGYNGLFQHEVFSSPGLPEEKIQQGKASRIDVVTSEENAELLHKLKTHLEQTKPYLHDGLTLTELANQLGMTRNQLSSLINTATGENFYTFINQYRVEEVKKLIANPKNNNFTLLTLALDAGFSSKSAFQAVFKKVTGLTPTEYRKNLS